MNIKLKAALEITGFLASAIIIGVLVRFVLNYLNTIYTTEQIINGIAFGFVFVTSYVMVGLLYDMRVAQLRYKEKLTEMVKK